MRDLVDRLHTLIDDLHTIDLHTLTPDELATTVIDLHHELDRLRAIHALTLVEADRARVWCHTGARNITDWLATHTHTSTSDAYRQTRLGDTLERSRTLTDAVLNGEISAATADTLHPTIAAPPPGADLDELIDLTRGATPTDARTIADTWTSQHTTETPDQASARRHAARRITRTHPTDGLITTTIVLPTHDAITFEQACYHASGGYTDHDDRTRPQLLADGLTNLIQLYTSSQLPGARTRPTIIATAPLDTLLGHTHHAAHTNLGTTLTPDTLHHLAENADIQLLIHAGNEILHLGRTTRYATDAQYRALLVRDGGCRWPGCNAPPATCEIDHYDEWTIAHGHTNLDRLGLWCPHHHRQRHRNGVKLEGTWDDLHIHLPNGDHIHCKPPRTLQAAA